MILPVGDASVIFANPAITQLDETAHGLSGGEFK